MILQYIKGVAMLGVIKNFVTSYMDDPGAIFTEQIHKTKIKFVNFL
jgi:hypothetical protein